MPIGYQTIYDAVLAAIKTTQGQIITNSGSQAVTSGVSNLLLNNGTEAINAVIDNSLNHVGMFTVKAGLEPADGQNHTLILLRGTFDGTNNRATFEDINDALVIIFDIAGNGTIINNTGTVSLDAVGEDGEGEFIEGTAGDDTLEGTEYNDTISGLGGNDTITGNTGDDLLAGGEGNDLYIFNLGDGKDIITDTSGFDNISFGEGITSDMVALFQDGSGNLVIDYGTVAGNDQITASGIDLIQLNSGSILLSSTISSVISQIISYATENEITLNSVEDVKNNADLMNIIKGSWIG